MKQLSVLAMPRIREPNGMDSKIVRASQVCVWFEGDGRAHCLDTESPMFSTQILQFKKISDKRAGKSLSWGNCCYSGVDYTELDRS